MNIKHIKNLAQKYEQQESTIQVELLMHKIKALQAKIVQQDTILDTLKFHNQELDEQLIEKNKIIQKINEQNKYYKNVIVSLEKQIQARKKNSEDIIRQIRQESSIIKQKNVKMCQVVNYLELQISELKENKQLLQQLKMDQEKGSNNQLCKIKILGRKWRNQKYKQKNISQGHLKDKSIGVQNYRKQR